MDGTLIDSATVIPDAYIACISGLGGPSYTPSEIIAAYSAGPPEAMLTRLLGRPSTPAEVDDYHVRLECLARGVTVYPGIKETLATLASQVPLAVFTERASVHAGSCYSPRGCSVTSLPSSVETRSPAPSHIPTGSSRSVGASA